MLFQKEYLVPSDSMIASNNKFYSIIVCCIKIYFLLTVLIMIFNLGISSSRKVKKYTNQHVFFIINFDPYREYFKFEFHVWNSRLQYSAVTCNSSFLNKFIFQLCEPPSTFSKHVSQRMYYNIYQSLTVIT